MRFSDLARWDVAGFGATGWNWPNEAMQPLGSLIQRISLEVDGKAPKKELPIIGKITFGGDLSLSDEDERQDYKGRLFWASAGQLVYSKIRVKQGSFCLVPKTLPLVAVSAEYPVYEIDANKAEPAYIDLLLRSAHMKVVLEGLSHGGGTKTRIHPEQFEALVVPVPPLATQHAIVSLWQKLQGQCSAIEITATTADQKTRPIVWTALGLSDPTATQAKPRTFAMKWSDIDRWGIDQIWQSRQVTATPTYPAHRIADLCRMGSGGTPSRAIASYFDGGDIPWVKTTEVRGEVITDTEEKITKPALKNSSAKLYSAGSLLIAMYGQGATRGRTAKLGIDATTNQACCALYDFVPEVLPDFLWYFLMAEYDRLRAMASGNNQPNLNAEMIANYRVPLPPLDVQQTLITAIGKARADALALRQQAKQLRERAKREIEAALLGNVSLSI